MSAVWGPEPEYIDFKATLMPEGKTLHVVVDDFQPFEEEPALVKVTLTIRLGPNQRATQHETAQEAPDAAS